MMGASMSDTREIEKKSLEAHVELCAERYRYLENKLSALDDKISSVGLVIREVHDKIDQMSNRRNDQIMTWSQAAIVSLVGIIGYLLAVFVIQ
jgi:enamine deaminase RidA (YjgF/YER057c/UK114 family)